MKKILIANRGEISVRVERTCRELGITSVAIYAEDDKSLPHVKKADMALSLGSGTLAETYLNIDKIVRLAKENNVDAIHPGYGFLSEKADFCQAVEKAGMIFIGPTTDSISLMGDKIASKVKAQQLKVPTIPGYQGDDQSEGTLIKEAKKIGFPVLIKATAGGGGKGMRIVQNEKEFSELLTSAKSEAQKAFANDKVLLEKYVLNPRHIEVQVFGDGKGGAVHLFERECSFQRRYQKIIEETPSTALDDKLRTKICETAVNLAKGIKYRGAGTVEFILAPSGDFYFLEMNTRLQVEHPITEEITGLDLVKMQIEVARDGKLSVEQKDITAQGHAIECRIYAEDPANGYLPTTGTLRYIGETLDPWVRLDTGYENSNEVGINYDPMIAKLIVRAANRRESTAKMIAALGQFPFLGVPSNRDFLVSLLQSSEFVSGKYHTNTLDTWKFDNTTSEEECFDFVAAQIFSERIPLNTVRKSGTSRTTPWTEISGEWLG